MALELIPLCTLTLTLGDYQRVGVTPSGNLVVIPVVDGALEGERVHGRLKPPAAADWFTIGPEGTATLDVRFTFETPDGALVFVAYTGRRDAADRDAPTYAYVRFETGDDRYVWLNRLLAVAKGRLDGQVATYEVYEVR